MNEPIPRLRRDIEIIPTSYQGEQSLMVKDTLGLIPEPVLLQAAGIALIRLIDGTRTLRDVQLAFMRQSQNVFIGLDVIEGMVAELDRAMLLDSPRYREARAALVDEYRRLDVREPFLAGRSYPEDPQQLRAYLAELLNASDTAATPPDEPTPTPSDIQALVAPHIDLSVGRRVYARSYRAVRGKKPPLVILLGTGHALQGHYFSVSEKNFATPLGETANAKPWAEAVKAAGGKAVSPDDFTHRSEHSLEFQLLFCQHLFGGEFSLLPILCGSFQELLGSVARPSEIPEIDRVLHVLRQAWEEEPGTLIIAGVDFSHIGRKFGHGISAAALLAEAKAHDLALIAALKQADINGFWEEGRRVQDRYNVCGYSALACLLEILPDSEGHLLDYEFWREEPTQSAVSFAAVLLTGPAGKSAGGEHDG
jgi:AmmeMemoRadiSam system protein B